ncbi:MAG: hypothetical protein JKY65_26395 [Planctomycetes bacterium]|nr:hypothetical protein [Planctomycetota bacterium]
MSSDSSTNGSMTLIATVYGAAVSATLGGGLGFVIFLSVCVFVAWLTLGGGAGGAKARGSVAPTQTRCVPHGQRCPLCHADFEIDEIAESCSDCETVFHRGCREEWKVCSTLGCRSKKRTKSNRGKPFRVVGITSRPKPSSGVRRRIRLLPDPDSGSLVAVRYEDRVEFPFPGAPADPGVSDRVRRLRAMANGRTLIPEGRL